MSGILSDAGCDSKEVLQGREHKCGGAVPLICISLWSDTYGISKISKTARAGGEGKHRVDVRGGG